MNLSNSALLSARSISASAIVVIALVLLYHLDIDGDRIDRHVTDALFFASVSALFFASKRFSERVLVFALLTAFCEAWATFGKKYRAAFYGTLFLMAAVWNLWASVGT